MIEKEQFIFYHRSIVVISYIFFILFMNLNNKNIVLYKMDKIPHEYDYQIRFEIRLDLIIIKTITANPRSSIAIIHSFLLF